jgi:oligosaccharide repeat unit polymerase
MYSLVTLPFYLIPLAWCARRGIFSASTVFFVYTLLGCWLLGALIESELVTRSILIAPWLIRVEDIPWVPMAAVNFAAFVSYRLFRKSKDRARRWQAPLNLPSNRRLLRYVLFQLFVIALEVSLTVYLYQGVQEWVRAAYARTVVESSALNFLFPVMIGVNVYCLVLQVLIKARQPPRWLRVLFLGGLVLQSIFLALSGGRSILLLFLISLLIVRVKRITRAGFLGILALAAAFVAASGYIIYERYRAQGASAQFEMSAASIVEASYTGLPFIDHIALSKIYAERRGNDYGEVYLNALVAFVPRAVWPEKPIQLSRRVREEFFGDTDGGVPPGLFGESVIAFDYFGLAMMALIFGLIVAKAENYAANAPNEDIGRLRTGVLSTLIGFILVRGGVDIGVYRVGLIVVMYLLLERLMTKSVHKARYVPVPHAQ